MEIGLYATSHGTGYRDDTNFFLYSLPANQLLPIQMAQVAEQAGFHSLWFPDHVCMPMFSESEHVANVSGSRAYESRHTMLDAAVTMGAVAARTTTLKLGTSVLVAPYRNPLSDARQFATVDQLSNGRLLFGVGTGWLQEEYPILGLDYKDRGKRTEECIEVYKRAWSDDAVSFEGRFYSFSDVSMDPKPVQTPRPPILYGGVTPAGARRAARLCDGFNPIFLDPYAQPERYADLHDLIRRELDMRERDPSDFVMMCISSARLTSADDLLAQERPRRICTGSAEQILDDLSRFAAAGYSLVALFFDCLSSREISEWDDQIRRFGEEVIPEAKKIEVKGGWNTAL